MTVVSLPLEAETETRSEIIPAVRLTACVVVWVVTVTGWLLLVVGQPTAQPVAGMKVSPTVADIRKARLA